MAVRRSFSSGRFNKAIVRSSGRGIGSGTIAPGRMRSSIGCSRSDGSRCSSRHSRAKCADVSFRLNHKSFALCQFGGRPIRVGLAPLTRFHNTGGRQPGHFAGVVVSQHGHAVLPLGPQQFDISEGDCQQRVLRHHGWRNRGESLPAD